MEKDSDKEYQVESIIKGKITGITNYGIFVKIDDNYNGLIHISEVSSDYVRNIEDFVSLGEEIYCEVLEVDKENKQLKLSIKNINYHLNNDDSEIKETRSGFLPLKEMLPKWIEEKLAVYKKEN